MQSRSIGYSAAAVFIAGLLQAQPVSFAPPVPYSVYPALGPRAIVAADFNGDGRIDLGVANITTNNFSILLGNGDGTFRAAQSFNSGVTYPQFLALGDFNSDGKLDVAIPGLDLAVSLGNGDGTFQMPITAAKGTFFTSILVGDFNGDGKLDMLALERGATTHGTVEVLLGHGDGTFSPGPKFASGGNYCDSMTFAGRNLVIANFVSNNVSVLRRQAGGFAPPVQYATGIGPQYVAAADLNHDGIPDLITANFDGDNISVLLGNPDGTYQAAVNYMAQAEPYWIAVADLNGDGNPDLAVVNASASSNSISVLLGNGDGTFQPATNFKAGGSLPSSIVTGLFNADNKPDLAVANQGSSVTVLLNTTP